jgi:tetratricopeptide (TPR) repeat protein
VMEDSLGKPVPRKAVLLVSCFAAAILTYQAIRILVADYLVHKDRIDQVERGVALESENAAAWERLGRVREADLANPDSAAAIADFQKAVAHVPLSAQYWMDLAIGYESVGNIPAAREAFGRARAAYPASSIVAWVYGNFLLRQGDNDAGFPQINHALQADPRLSDPKLVPLAVSRVWHLTQDANVLLNQVLPPDQDAYFQAIDFMVENRQPTAALLIWQRLLSLGKPIELRRSFPVLWLLIESDLGADASRVWREALAAAGLPHDEPASPSLIWNGDFARDFLNGGLDWRWNSSLVGASIGFEAVPPSSEGRSLRLDFSGGENLNLMEPQQFVPVEPSRRYHFHALLKTEGLTTENGISFLISDPNHGAAIVATEKFTGTHSWTPVDADYTTTPATHFMSIQVRRAPSRLFDNKLSGTAWISDVSLTPSDGAEPPHTQ